VGDVQIVVVDGPNAGREFELSGSTVVGRDQSAGLVIDDPEASRRHASLSVADATVTVEDLGSTNGTFVNGARISPARELTGGDKVRIGTTVFEVRVEEDEPEAVQATRVGTDLPDLDSLQVTAPRQLPDFTKEEQTITDTHAAPEPLDPPEAPAPEPVASEPIPPASSAPPPPSYAPPSYVPTAGLAPSPYAAAAAAGELSGWWRRVGATLLDGLISLPFLIFGYVLIVSPILMKREGANNGQTWGKQALGIRVVQDNHQPFTFGTALLRDFVIKSLLFSVIPFSSLVDSLWPLWDDENQALHDKIASSHVFRA
jgi:pSer/pThr/pTyr-binding forkhead associated (FHA) protein